MTKFRVTYEKAVANLMTFWPESAIVTLPCTTREEAGAIIHARGGFIDEMPTGCFIAAGAIKQIDVMTS